MNIIRPSRQFRRDAAGKRCPACSNTLHWHDVVALLDDTEIVALLHDSCALAIAESADTEAREDDES